MNQREGNVRKTSWLTAAAYLSFAMAAGQAIISIWPAAAAYFQAPPRLLTNRLLLLVVGGSAALIPVAFGLYALSGAGRIRRLPFLRTALITVGTLFTLRGLFIIMTVLVALGLVRGEVSPLALASHLVFLAAGTSFLAGTVLNWPALRPPRR